MKELNLCELLKGHEGETFYSPLCGMDELIEIMVGYSFPIATSKRYYTKDGRTSCDEEAECMLFPSKELYAQYPLDPCTAWTKWAEKNKKVTYMDVYDALFGIHGDLKFKTIPFTVVNTKAGYKIDAINKLMNVQKYLEKDCKPTYDNDNYVIYIDKFDNLYVDLVARPNYMSIFFSSKANALKAIEILGEDTIRNALSTD